MRHLFSTWPCVAETNNPENRTLPLGGLPAYGDRGSKPVSSFQGVVPVRTVSFACSNCEAHSQLVLCSCSAVSRRRHNAHTSLPSGFAPTICPWHNAETDSPKVDLAPRPVVCLCLASVSVRLIW